MTVSKKPRLSINCITYNQEKFIRQTLDGFLMQKTNFPFVIYISDDASTDKTPEIIKEYAEKYPDIVNLYYARLMSEGRETILKICNVPIVNILPIVKGTIIGRIL